MEESKAYNAIVAEVKKLRLPNGDDTIAEVQRRFAAWKKTGKVEKNQEVSSVSS